MVPVHATLWHPANGTSRSVECSGDVEPALHATSRTGSTRATAATVAVRREDMPRSLAPCHPLGRTSGPARRPGGRRVRSPGTYGFEGAPAVGVAQGSTGPAGGAGGGGGSGGGGGGGSGGGG